MVSNHSGSPVPTIENWMDQKIVALHIADYVFIRKSAVKVSLVLKCRGR